MKYDNLNIGEIQRLYQYESAGFKAQVFNVLYFIELFWILIDIIGGYFLHLTGGASSINLIIRGGIFFFLIFVLFFGCEKISFRFFAFAIVITALTFLQLLVFGNFNIISTHIKIFLFPLFLEILKYQIDKGYLTKKKINTIIYFNFSLMLVNIVLGFFKIGYSNYGVSQGEIFQGSQGFFYSGNELAAVFLAISSLMLWLTLQHKKKVNFYIVSLLLAVCAVGILSKTSVFGFGVLFLAVIIINRPKAIPILVFGGFIVLMLIGDELFTYLNLLFQRIHHFGQLYGYDIVFMGGEKRYNAIKELLSLMANNEFLILTGTGWQGYTENNLFDILGAFGIFGLIIIFIWSEQLVYLARSFLSKRDFFPLFLGYFIIFLVSIFAGHIMQSAMVSLFIALMASLRFVYR